MKKSKYGNGRPFSATVHRQEGVYFHIALFPEAKLDFVTKLSRIHGNIIEDQSDDW